MSYAYLSYTNFIFTIPSVIGNSIMVGSYIFVPSLQSPTMKFIMGLTFSDFLYNFSNILEMFQNGTDNEYCKVEAFIREAGFLQCQLWTVSLFMTLYIVGKNSNKIRLKENFVKIGLAIILISFIPSMIISFCEYFDGNGEITFTYNVEWGYCSATAIVETCIAIPVVICISISIFLNCRMTKELTIEQKEDYKKIVLYPIWTLIIYLPYLINIYWEDSFWNIIHIASTRSIGLVNCLVFGGLNQVKLKEALFKGKEKDAENEFRDKRLDTVEENLRTELNQVYHL